MSTSNNSNTSKTTKAYASKSKQKKSTPMLNGTYVQNNSKSHSRGKAKPSTSK